jgi:hypothetical protein
LKLIFIHYLLFIFINKTKINLKFEQIEIKFIVKMLNKKYEDFKQNYRTKMQIENDINK